MTSFDSFLQVLIPYFPRALISPTAVAAMRKTTRGLAPIYRGGLECRLTQDDSRVDLHQCILMENGEPELLIKHIQRSGLCNHPAWRKIKHLLQHGLRVSSPLNADAKEIWLEFDIGAGSPGTRSPSIFLQLSQPASDGSDRKDFFQTLETVIDSVLPGSGANRLKKTLMRCNSVCPEGAGITHLGLMLARKTDAIRLNVSGLTANQWQNFLKGIDWPGSIEAFRPIIDSVYERTDRIVFCLDVGRTVTPNLGLECLIDSRSERNSDWNCFLKYLVDQGMCSPEKREAVLDWPTYIKPPDAPQQWPDNLIIESLIRGPDCFSLFCQSINHLKIVLNSDKPPVAKGYLWFGHVWANRSDIEKIPITLPSINGHES